MTQRVPTVSPASEDLLERALDAVPTAVAVLRSPRFTIELANRAAVTLAGGVALIGRSLAEAVPEVAEHLLPHLARVVATGAPARLVGVPLAPAFSASPPLERTFSVQLLRLTGAEAGPGPPAVLVTAEETTGEVVARREVLRALATEQAIRARLAAGQRITAALASARTVQEVAEAVFENDLAAFGAAAGWIALPEGSDRLRVAASAGYPEERLGPWRTFPVAAEVPAAEAFRARRPVFVESRAELARRYPALAATSPGPASCVAALPLLAEGLALGVLGLSFEVERAFTDEDRRHVGWLAQKCAQALERARVYEAERTARAQAVEIGRLQEQLMAVVGHDLRSPLTAITTTAELLVRRGGLDERQGVAVARIADGAARMGAIIRDLLDLSVARQGLGIPVRREATDLAEVARRAVLEAEAGGGRGVVLRLSGDTRLSADPGRLAQVLSNLLGNALQHGDGEPVALEVEGRPAEVSVRVHNAGPPIPPGFMPHLFEPFHRGAAPARAAGPRGPSIGLGLFIVREIVRAHGGAVEVRSTAGAGTTFEVRLPRPAAEGGAA